MRLLEYADRDMLAIDLANKLAGELEAALFHTETASLAVPGGTTPQLVFDALSAVHLEWHRVHVLPTDERWVPEAHARSNGRLIRARLLVDNAAAATFVPLYRDVEDPGHALEEIAATVRPELPLSILVLGMGSDMHVASLFPGAPGLTAALDSGAGPVAVLRPENQPDVRVSLTAPALNGALSKHLVIFGREKREALERALGLPPEEAPVQAVLTDMTVHWAD